MPICLPFIPSKFEHDQTHQQVQTVRKLRYPFPRCLVTLFNIFGVAFVRPKAEYLYKQIPVARALHPFAR